jgi:hypothetical protein
MPKCKECKNFEKIDIGKKEKVSNCSIGLIATRYFLHYCGGFKRA